MDIADEPTIRSGWKQSTPTAGPLGSTIDPATERLWWSSTFVPPGPGHPRATVAIGTEAGVAVFDLETGQRTRVFAGHSAPVVSLVPSPDGRWLASSSLDQTVMIYPLAGCDTRPGLGATFRQRPDGSWTVASVKRQEPRRRDGLEDRRRHPEAGIGTGRDTTKLYPKPEEIAEFVKRVDGWSPRLSTIGIKVRKDGSHPGGRCRGARGHPCRPPSGTTPP